MRNLEQKQLGPSVIDECTGSLHLKEYTGSLHLKVRLFSILLSVKSVTFNFHIFNRIIRIQFKIYPVSLFLETISIGGILYC